MARPKDYKTARQMQKAIDKYFEACMGKPLLDTNGNVLTDKWGKPVMLGAKPPTITGLALALGFNSRQTLLNYQAQEEFMDTITRAKTRCEEYTEMRLYDKDGAKGAQFSLTCNFGWGQQKTAQTDGRTNNLLQSIQEAGEIDTDDLPEVE